MIEGVQVIPLAAHVDDRGYLIEIARRADDPAPHGVIHKFGQIYLVGSSIVKKAHRTWRPTLPTPSTFMVFPN